MDLSLTLFGDTQLAGRLLQTSERVDDAAPWFRMMSGYLEEQLDKQFSSQGKHWSGGWKALSPAYAAQKALDGYGDKPILERTGALRQSLTSGNADTVRIVSSHQLVYGSTVSYGPIHQKGGKTMPRRAMLDLDSDEKRRMVRSLGLFIARGTLKEPSGMTSRQGGGKR